MFFCFSSEYTYSMASFHRLRLTTKYAFEYPKNNIKTYVFLLLFLQVKKILDCMLYCF